MMNEDINNKGDKKNHPDRYFNDDHCGDADICPDGYRVLLVIFI